MSKCNNIDSCEWWFCREKKVCLLHEQEHRDKPMRQIFTGARKGIKSGERQKITGVKKRVYERDGYKCVFCESPDNLTLDHIYPASLGGKTTIDNLQTLCRKCNFLKKDTYPYVSIHQVTTGVIIQDRKSKRLGKIADINIQNRIALIEWFQNYNPSWIGETRITFPL